MAEQTEKYSLIRKSTHKLVASVEPAETFKSPRCLHNWKSN
jgi:hypothetical protein